MWLRQKDFGDVVKEAWQNSGGDSQSLSSRLQQCGEYLKRWNRKVFGQVKTKMRNLKEQLDLIRMKPREESVLKEEEYLVSQLDEWRFREEIYWRQRSREEWLTEGDRNTRFLHAKASHRRKINTIEEIKDCSGIWLKDEKEIAQQVRSYFSGLFESSIKNRHIYWNQRLLDVQRRVPVGSDMALCGPVTELEKINLGKSEVVFSRNTRSEDREEICQILMVSMAETHSKYLGLPVSFSHNKSELFRYLVDRLWRKVMGWKELQLSAAGKDEVMIKAVLQSIP
ncbi:hypothetical protein QQ045_006962 [Rhodiola kirilowii]